MKKIALVMTVVLALFAAGCNSRDKEKTAEGVAEDFVKAFNSADLDKIYNLSTEKSHILLDNMTKNRTHEEMDIIRARQIEVDSVNVVESTDSTATCMCYFRVKDTKDQKSWAIAQQEWSLMKEGGEWKVMMVQP